jgi:hypothetical protein
VSDLTPMTHDPDHPAAVAERAAVLAYLALLVEMMTTAGETNRARDVAIIAAGIETGAHRDAPPETRCQARTTAPGEE